MMNVRQPSSFVMRTWLAWLDGPDNNRVQLNEPPWRAGVMKDIAILTSFVVRAVS